MCSKGRRVIMAVAVCIKKKLIESDLAGSERGTETTHLSHTPSPLVAYPAKASSLENPRLGLRTLESVFEERPSTTDLRRESLDWRNRREEPRSRADVKGRVRE